MESRTGSHGQDVRFEPDEQPTLALTVGLALQYAILTVASVVLTPVILIGAVSGSEAYLSWVVFAAQAAGHRLPVDSGRACRRRRGQPAVRPDRHGAEYDLRAQHRRGRSHAGDGPRARRLKTELTLENFPKIDAYLAEFAAGGKRDREMTERLRAVGEEMLLTLTQPGADGEAPTGRRLLCVARDDGDAVDLEFAATSGEANLEN